MTDRELFEKAHNLRHKEFLKEAEALGYVIRLNTGTSKWEVRNKMKDDDDTQVYRSELEAAVKAAVAAEREACAKVCDEVGNRDRDSHAWDAAAAIRARGQA